MTDKINKALAQHCRNCKYRSFFRDSFECVECINNPQSEFFGHEHKFELSEDLSKELAELNHFAEIGKAVKWAWDNDIKWFTVDDDTIMSVYEDEIIYLVDLYRSQQTTTTA